MTSFFYTISILLLCSITIVSAAGVAFGGLLVFIPMGLKWFVLASLLGIFTFFIYLHSNRKYEIRKAWSRILLLWVPFILYIIVRSEFLPVGLWKLAGFIMKVFFPCAVAIVLYVDDRDRFEKIFIPVVLVLNVLLAIAAPMIPSDETIFNLSIWLSRGLAVAIFLIITELAWNRQLVYKIPLILFMSGVMIFIGSRGPFLSLLVAISLYFALAFKYKIIAIPMVLYFMFISVILLYCMEPAQEALNSFLTHGHRNQMKVENFANDRIRLLKPTLDIVKENPVFGCGLGNWVIGYMHAIVSDKSYSNFNYKSEFKKDYYYYPHNLLCELICELGVVGLVLYGLIFFSI